MQRPLKFIKYLKEFGWNPIVICPQPGIYTLFDESLQKELEGMALEIIRVNPKTLFHFKSEKVNKQGKAVRMPEFFSRLLRRISRLFYYPDNKKGWIEPALAQARHIIRKKNIDVIFSTAPPFSNHIIGARLKREFHIPLVLDYRDAWYRNHFFDELFGWQKSIMHRMETESLQQANAVIGLDQFMLDQMNADFPRAAANFYCIPHGFDPADFENPPASNLNYQNGKLNVLYNGLFYEQNQPYSFLDGIQFGIMRNYFSKNDIHLHFQGGLHNGIKKKIAQLGLSDIVEDYGYVNHDLAVSNILKADLLWMISAFSPSHRQVKSGKLFEYFGSGKPVLGLVEPGEEWDLLQKYGAGFVADVNSPQSIAHKIMEILSLKNNEGFIKANPQFIEAFNREKLTQALARIFNEITVNN